MWVKFLEFDFFLAEKTVIDITRQSWAYIIFIHKYYDENCKVVQTTGQSTTTIRIKLT